MRNKKKAVILLAGSAFILSGCVAYSALKNSSTKKKLETENRKSVVKIICFYPEVIPDVEEIKFLTYQTYFSSLSNKLAQVENYKILQVESSIKFDSVVVEDIRQTCEMNQAQYAIVPSVKYFKVGLGKYVFSNQVVVGMKLYDGNGNLLEENFFDTYRKNKRLLGSTTNSIRIGTEGALKEIIRQIKEKESKNTWKPHSEDN